MAGCSLSCPGPAPCLVPELLPLADDGSVPQAEASEERQVVGRVVLVGEAGHLLQLLLAD